MWHVCEAREGAYRVLVGRPEEKRPLCRYRRILKDNIKMHFSRSGMRDWTGLIWLRIGTGDSLL